MSPDDPIRPPTRRRFLAATGLGAATLGLAGSTRAGGPQAKPGDRPASPWTKMLDNGATVELLGVTSLPAGANTWWSPTGERLAAPRLDFRASGDLFERGSGIPGSRTFRFVARVVGVKEADKPEILWTVSRSFLSPDRYLARPGDDPGVIVVGADATLDRDVAACNVRLGVTWLPHIKLLEAEGSVSTTTRTPIGSICFARARRTERGTALVAVDNLADGFGNIRFTAIDRDGKTHHPESSGTEGDGLRMMDAEFKIPPEAIEHFRFEARPYQWVEFTDVPLRPARGG